MYAGDWIYTFDQKEIRLLEAGNSDVFAASNITRIEARGGCISLLQINETIWPNLRFGHYITKHKRVFRPYCMIKNRRNRCRYGAGFYYVESVIQFILEYTLELIEVDGI